MTLFQSICRKWVMSQIAKSCQNEVQVIDDWQAPTVEEFRHCASSVIRVKCPKFYTSLLTRGSLGLANSYADGLFECNDLTQLFRVLIRNLPRQTAILRFLQALHGFPYYITRKFRKPSVHAAKSDIQAHYDIGNNLFELILDPTMTYSCGIFEDQHFSLSEASVKKLDRICQLLHLQPGMSVLETGSGWGSFAIHAAKNYGCKIVTVTLSEEQFAEARQRVRAAGLGNLVEVRLQDYRDVEGKFDRLVSIEMIEAIGHDELPTYFQKCSSLLKPDGEMFLQVITMPESRYKFYLRSTDFIRQVIFPGSCCPSKAALFHAISLSSDFVVFGTQEIGQHYAKTLREWNENLGSNHDHLLRLGYSERFLRIWHYYFCYCEAGFAENYIGNSQMHLCKPQAEALKVGGPIRQGSVR